MLQVKWKGKNNRFTHQTHLISHCHVHNNMVHASETEGYKYQIPTDYMFIQRLLNLIDLKISALSLGW